jgi:hypothetical protein
MDAISISTGYKRYTTLSPCAQIHALHLRVVKELTDNSDSVIAAKDVHDVNVSVDIMAVTAGSSPANMRVGLGCSIGSMLCNGPKILGLAAGKVPCVVK